MKKLTTRQLEDTMIRYRDLIHVPVADSGEPMTIMDPAVIKNGYSPEMPDMTSVLDNKIVFRKTVIRMLKAAQKRLRRMNKNYSLHVTYGYRSLEIQTNIFRTIASG